MSTSWYGIKTIANDGFEYDSRFEAEFVNKFLIPHNINYERQKQYSSDSKHRCDFYLPDYDIWIECVYMEYSPIPLYMLGTQDVVFNIPYEDTGAREVAKHLGARYHPKVKKWILNRNKIPSTGLYGMEPYMYEDQLEPWWDPVQVNMTEKYNANLREKITKYGDEFTILQVNKTDLEKKASHFADLLRVKDFGLYMKLRHLKPELIPEIKTLGRVPEPKEPVVEEKPPKPDKPIQGSAVVNEDGTVTYISKRQAKANSKEEARQKRFATFKNLINGSSTADLKEFHRTLTKIISDKERVAELKSKKFPDK